VATPTITDLTDEQLRELVTGLGGKPFQARQLAHWVYKHGARSYEECRNLPRSLLEKLAARPDGVDLGPMVPRLDEVLETPSGKIDLAPDHLTADVPRLHRALQDGEDGLVLVSRRHVRSNNSWMHNVPSLVTGKDRCTLLIHPDDAAERGIGRGGLARVRSSAGTLEVPVEISDEMRPGVVCLPHGWGHDKDGVRLGVASRHAAVCNNVLAPGELVDPASGNAVVNGIPVEVTPV